MSVDPAFDDSDEECVVLLALAVAASHRGLAPSYLSRDEPIGPEKLRFWRSREETFYRMMGMTIATFDALVSFYVQRSLSRSRFMEVEEKLAIFIYICRFGVSQPLVADTFGRSGSTVSEVFNTVLNCL